MSQRKSPSLKYKSQDTSTIIYKIGEDYEAKGQFQKALKCYQRASKILDGNIIYKLKEAKILNILSRHQEALSLIQSLDLSNIDSSHLHSEIANIYAKSGYIYDAINHLKKAIILDGKNPKYYLILADLLHKEALVDEAIACYQTSLYYDRENCIAYNNLAIALKDNHSIDESIKNFMVALMLCPDESFIHWNYAHTLLISGKLKEGFAEYQWRLKKPDYKQYIRDYNKPLWDGHESRGKTILVYAEQGLGDTIQFFRYLKLLQQRGFNIIFQCHRELKSLFKNVLEQVYSFDEPLPHFDLQCPLLSLPHLFQTDLDTIPVEIPYLSSTDYQKEKWFKLIGNHNLIKVGLAWAGNPNHENDKNRSMDLSFFTPLFSLEGFSFFSLQVGHKSIECKFRESIVHLTNEIIDFSDTAGFIDNLDIIITVDTAIAHLSGAMGKNTWILLPFTPDWRWMLYGDKSLWYPTVRLFRQKKRGDWQGVVKEVVKECMQLKS